MCETSSALVLLVQRTTVGNMRRHLSECESEICLEQILISEFEAQFKITNQSCVFASLIMFYCKNNLKKSKKSLVHRLCQSVA